MTKARSPVLGYNHNVRYAGRLWHVQTEDSGVQNPHIFTHLFHDGTILATKRFDYDASSAVEVVQKFMQSQHKAMLRDLKQGTFDEKIGKFFGEPVKRETAETAVVSEQELPTLDETPASAMQAPTVLEAPAIPQPIVQIEVETPEKPTTKEIPSQLSKSVLSKSQLSASEVGARAAAATQRIDPALKQTRPRISKPRKEIRPFLVPAQKIDVVLAQRAKERTASRSPLAVAPVATAEGVIVARPTVVVGGGAQVVSRHNQAVTRERATAVPSKPPAPGDTIFGAAPPQERSLDEVILAYLSEDLTEK